jgi:hypothetical protein
MVKIYEETQQNFMLIYSYFYYYSHGLDFDDHGYFNFLGGITIVFILLLALLPFNQLVYLIKKKTKYILQFTSAF